jgi:hypothetical protein
LSNVVQTLLSTVVAIRLKTRPELSSRTDIHILTPDITEKDNASLAIAVQRIVTAFAPLYNAKLIEPKEFVRLVYRFVAETMPEAVGDFAPVNVRGGGSKLPNTDPDDPKKDDPNSP